VRRARPRSEGCTSDRNRQIRRTAGEWITHPASEHSRWTDDLQPCLLIPARLLRRPRGGGACAVTMAGGAHVRLGSPDVRGAHRQAEQVDQVGARDPSCPSAGDDDALGQGGEDPTTFAAPRGGSRQHSRSMAALLKVDTWGGP
jgi:hypothetical protein